MKTLVGISVSAFLIVMGTAFAPQARADAWNQLTKVTFSGPVEVPGAVLPAGTYWFKLLNPESGRDVVQITNKAQDMVYATLLAVPDYRLKPTGKTVITFEERASKSPEALKAWFYPGDNFGEQFVYPRTRAAQLAKRTNQPVLSMPDNMEANTKAAPHSGNEPSVTALKQAPVKAEQPNGQESEIETIIVIPPQFTAAR